MDADDIALPNRLQEQLRYLKDHPDVDICGACVEIFVDDGEEGAQLAGGNRRYQAWLNACRSPQAIRRELFIESPIPNPTALFRREALQRLEGYRDPDWPEDYDLFLRADGCGMRMGKPDDVLLRWREHGRRLTRTDPRYAWSRFQAAKAHHLAGGRLRGQGSGGHLGGGAQRAADARSAAAQRAFPIHGFLDVHPRRVGGQKARLAGVADRATGEFERPFCPGRGRRGRAHAPRFARSCTNRAGWKARTTCSLPSAECPKELESSAMTTLNTLLVQAQLRWKEPRTQPGASRTTGDGGPGRSRPGRVAGNLYDRFSRRR